MNQVCVLLHVRLGLVNCFVLLESCVVLYLSNKNQQNAQFLHYCFIKIHTPVNALFIKLEKVFKCT